MAVTAGGGGRRKSGSVRTGTQEHGARSPQRRKSSSSTRTSTQEHGSRSSSRSRSSGGGGGGGGGSRSRSGGGGGTDLTREEYAAMVGWGLAVINSSNELKSIFNKAMREDWDPGRFAAAVRNTKWYKNHTEAWRKNEVLRLTDPQEWKARRKAIWDSVRDQAAQMGAVLSTAQVSKIVTNIQQQGWSEATIRNALADFVKFKDGMLFGQAGATGDALRQTSLDNAYKLSDNQLLDWVRAVARGDRTVEDYQRFVREQAAKKYVAFADQLRAGADLRDIAAPYIDMYAEELELNPKDIQLTDKLLTKALTWRNPNSGEVEGMDFSTWQEALRNDPRWRRTRAANEMTAGLLVDIGRAFGKLAA